MDSDMFKGVSGYEELEILLAVSGFQDDRRNVLMEISRYNDNFAYCVPTANGFVWYSKASLERIDPPDRIDGNFSCSFCDSLVSLEGCPKNVGRDFYCFGCGSLVSLKGSPAEVRRNFDCSCCKSLVSLEGCPEKVGMDLNCTYCPSLKSFNHMPKRVGGEVYR